MTPDRYAHVVSFALSHPWMVLPEMMPVIAGILARHISGVESSAEIAAALVNRKNLPQPKVGSVAIIPVYGLIAPRVNLMTEMSGGTTFEKLTQQTRAAVADPAVRTLVLDIDSSGSNACGAIEYTRELLKARTKKPVIAQVQFMAGSGAYWVAASCTEVVAAPSAKVGSIGVYTIHDDLSALLALEGIKRTYLSVGEGKVDGNETGPLSTAAAARRMASITEAYAEQFQAGVVEGRGKGMTTARVRDEWKAFVYGSAEALSIGMIDRIATLDETLTRLLSDSPDATDQRAALSFTSISDTSQEPAQATDQDRAADLTWQNTNEAAALDLSLYAEGLRP